MNFIQLLLVLQARKKVILLTLIVTVITAAAVSIMTPKTYLATASVLVDSQNIDPITGLKLSSDLLPGYMATQVDIITSHNVAARVVDDLKIAEEPKIIAKFREKTDGRGAIRDWVADLLLGKLKVKASHDSSVIDISYLGNDPESAATIANAFVNAYILANLDLKTQPAKQTAAWFDTQLKELRDNLENAQAKLAAYQSAHDIVIGGQEPRGVISGNQMDAESARLEALSAQLVAAQTQSYESISKSRNAADSSAEVMNNPTVQDVSTSLIKAEAKLSQLGSTEGVNNPEYQSAQAEVNKLRQNLASQIQLVRQSIANTAGTAEQNVAALRAAVAAQKARVLSLKGQQDQGSVLMREVDNAQRTYDAALQSFGQFKLQSKASQTDVSILNPAVIPLRPSGPRTLLNIIIAIFLGALLGFGFSLALEIMDRRVRSEDDLSRELGLPLLGVITSIDAATARRPWFRRSIVQSHGNHLAIGHDSPNN